MKNFALWFYPRLSEQLHYDQIGPELASAFPPEEMAFFVTNNHRRTIGVMNHHVRIMKDQYAISKRRGVTSAVQIASLFNGYLMGPKPYIRPVEEMRKYLGGG